MPEMSTRFSGCRWHTATLEVASKIRVCKRRDGKAFPGAMVSGAYSSIFVIDTLEDASVTGLAVRMTRCRSGRDSNCRSSLGLLTLGRGGFHGRFRRCYSSGIHQVEPSHSEVCGCNISVPKRR